MKQNLQLPHDKTPLRTKLLVVCGREPGFATLQKPLNKVPELKRAFQDGSTFQCLRCFRMKIPRKVQPIAQDSSQASAAQRSAAQIHMYSHLEGN